MNQPAPSPVQQPAPPRPRRWLRRVVLFVALVSVTLLSIWGYTKLAFEIALANAIAETDELDPGWRFDELQANRAEIPDDDNSALFLIPLAKKGQYAGPFDGGRILPIHRAIFSLPRNVQYNEEQVQLFRAELAKLGPLRKEARKLKDMPRGRLPIVYTDDFVGTLRGDETIQTARNLANWLQYDAMLLAQEGEGDCNQAAESCLAMLMVTRTQDGEPILTAHLVRIAIHHMAFGNLERVLAQGTASEPVLRNLQSALETDLGPNHNLIAWRGERARHHQFFENVRGGKVRLKSLKDFDYHEGLATFEQLVLDKFPSSAFRNYPQHLRFMNRLVAIAKLPLHEQNAKYRECVEDIEKSKNPLPKVLLSHWLYRMNKTELRFHAFGRSTIAALACERYRLKHGFWPASLDVLVREKLLSEVPRDPFDNLPLRYRRTKDGIAVYTLGVDLIDNHGNLDRAKSPEAPGVDIGFRLWDVKSRRRPPLAQLEKE